MELLLRLAGGTVGESGTCGAKAGGLRYCNGIAIGEGNRQNNVTFARKKQRGTMDEEWFPLVNGAGEITGKATRHACHSGTKWLHPVVHLHIFNRAGCIYLQKRTLTKDIQPGKWDTAVGGHVSYGETVEQALRREAREELGIIGFTYRLVSCYIFESEIERELVHAFRTLSEGPFFPDPSELDDGRFWQPEEIVRNVGRGLFTPNFEQEYRRLFMKQQ